jgi:glucosamine 6-phosphate synthetase-like amidotransferase/phosphosugar isomerase protein
MCGIAGVSLSPREKVNARNLASALLLGIEERGQHATGTAWDNNGEVWISKAAIPASTYVHGDHVPVYARTFIAHTRWATQGSTQENANNHPIDVRGIVGIHNGCISNDDALFDLIGSQKRIAEVDSEAIFAMILHSGLEVIDSLELLRGSAALAWYDSTDTSVLHLARVSSSPLIFGVTDAGSLLFASTEKAVRKAAEQNGLTLSHVYATPEGFYYQVKDGQIIASQQFQTQYGRTLTATERRALNVA